MKKLCALALLGAVGLSSPILNAQQLRKAALAGNGPPAAEAKKTGTQPPDGETPTRAAPPSLPIFYLRDQSKVAGTPKLDFLAVQTRYGMLKIPPSDLIQVRFSQRVDPAVGQRAQKLIEQLGNEDFDVRENAMESLRKLGGAALPLLREATRSSNEEIQNRAEILADELQAEKPSRPSAADSLGGVEGSEDEIVTTRMTIRGRVLAAKFVIETRYGELDFDVADLKAVSFQRAGPAAGKWEVQPRYQAPGNWYDTKFELEKGQRFSIEASGVITVSNYSVSCGPTGTREWGGQSWNNFAQLSLVGKVGKKGKPFLVGNAYKGKESKGGRLYLAIVPFSYNPAGAIGKYTAKIKASGIH
jgi:hypothetical protein